MNELTMERTKNYMERTKNCMVLHVSRPSTL